MNCPNCGSEAYYRHYDSSDRCVFCWYNSKFPDIKPTPPAPLQRVDTTSPEWKAEVKEYITTHGYTCCGSKVVDRHEPDCASQRKKRGETWST